MLMTLLVLSITFQFVAAGLSFVHIRKSEKATAWIVLSIAFLLMAIRRSISLMHTISSEVIIIDPYAESVALLISVLMVIGVLLIGKIFARLNNLAISTQTELDKRIKAEKTLTRQNVLLKEMGRLAKVGAWELDPFTGQGTWTDQIAHIHDLPSQNENFFQPAVGLDQGKNFYAETSKQRIQEAVEKAINNGESYDLELELISAKNIRKWVRTIGLPIRENGKVVRLLGAMQDITEQKRNQQKILHITKRQEQLADIIEKSEQPLGIGYPDGSLGMCNTAFCDLTGYSMEELKTLDWNKTLTPSKWNASETEALKQLAHTSKPVRYQKEYIHKDGHIIPIEVLAHVARDENNKPIFYYAFISDITERMAYENALKNSEKRFEDIALSSADWIWECNADAQYTFAAGKVEEITGYTAEELINKSIFDMMTEKDADKIKNCFKEKCQTKQAILDIPNTFVAKDGRTVYLQTCAVPVLDKQKNLLGYRGVNRDVTAQKLATDELKKHRENLEELAEARAIELADLHKLSSTILETAPIGIVTYDTSGQCIRTNESAAEMVGASQQQVLSQNFNTIESWKISGLTEVAKKCMETGKCQQKAVTLSTSFGKKIIIDCRFARFMLKQKPHLLLTFSDITNRVKAEQALKTFSHQLRIANKELEAFSYSVSHDLRAPLRSIDGFSQAILEDYEDKLDDEGKDDLHRIRNAAQRMGQLIEDLLQLSRISRWKLETKPLDLGSMAQNAINSLREQQPDRNVEVIIAENMTVEADPRLMRLVIENLIGNAWKFTNKTSDATIEVGRLENRELCTPNPNLRDDIDVFFVKDNGAGFDMTYADKLFGAFQRLHTVSEFDGTGIGLATVMRAILREGGIVWAEGAVDKGATLYFTLQT